MTKMVVQNLSPLTTVESLRQLFAAFGTVRTISLATDVMTGRCGGLGFVNLSEQNDGAALDALDGKRVDGCVLHVSLETKRDPYNYYN